LLAVYSISDVSVNSNKKKRELIMEQQEESEEELPLQSKLLVSRVSDCL
jgi:hypothetical protein